MKVAIIGATGLVGQTMLQVLEERDFSVSTLIPVASERSLHANVTFRDRAHRVRSVQDALDLAPDIVLFSAGASVSKEWAPAFAEKGSYVIDNSSAWRMDTNVPLVVPEVNAHVLEPKHRIIANPNCSTIQMVVALAPIHRAYGIRRLVVATYQSFSGTGARAVRQYNNERAGKTTEGSDNAYPHPIFENCIPHCDVFLEDGYSREEHKIVRESRKILEDDQLAVTATAVRVPVDGAHSEAINVALAQAFELNDIVELMRQAPGVVLADDPANNLYPMPLYAKGRDEVFVGRLRRDTSIDHGLNLWVVADNLRKGAATNAIQIAEHIVKRNWMIARRTA